MRECAKNRFTIISSRDYPDIKYFAEDNNISKKIFTSYYMEKKILVEDSFRRKGLKIKKGEKVEFLLEDEKNIIVREKMKLDIIFEDDDILLVNKPVAMSVHPTRYEQVGTLFNGVSQYFYEKNLDRKIRVVNRLDRNTSGLVLFAKSQIVDYRLSEQFKNRQVVKKYMALVEGRIDSEGCIEEPILHNEGSKKRVDPRGKYALTKYKRIGEYKDFSLIDIEIPTGRSHQIRVLKLFGTSTCWR